MKERIIKLIRGLAEKDLRLLLSFVKNEDIDFINQLDYSKEELIEECVGFFDSKDTLLLRRISKDLENFNKALKNKIYKPRKASKSALTVVVSGGEEVRLTDNQKIVLKKIEQLIARSDDKRIRTDSVEIKDKSKFFLGGVLTTLIEKNLIQVTLDKKTKFITLTSN